MEMEVNRRIMIIILSVIEVDIVCVVKMTFKEGIREGLCFPISAGWICIKIFSDMVFLRSNCSLMDLIVTEMCLTCDVKKIAYIVSIVGWISSRSRTSLRN